MDRIQPAKVRVLAGGFREHSSSVQGEGFTD
jgi:hypothetical protein